jgi:SAM-dependent methyltransferase
MYNRLARYRFSPPAASRALSISGSQSLCRLIGFDEGQIEDASYPSANVLDLPHDDSFYELVASDQVLEHIEGNPQRAIDECFRVLRPGGMAIHTTCFMQTIHAAPSDFWRFTPSALALLVRPHAKVIEADGWGNLWFLLLSAIGMRSVPVPHSRWHPWNWLATHNMANWPVVTWVVARKEE